MRITLNIPDDIHRCLKMKAASERTTMRALILREIDVYLQSKAAVKPIRDDTETHTEPAESSHANGALTLTSPSD